MHSYTDILWGIVCGRLSLDLADYRLYMGFPLSVVFSCNGHTIVVSRDYDLAVDLLDVVGYVIPFRPPYARWEDPLNGARFACTLMVSRN